MEHNLKEILDKAEQEKQKQKAFDIADMVLAAEGQNNAEKFYNAAKDMESRDSDISDVLKGLGDATAMVNEIADFALGQSKEEAIKKTEDL